MARYDRDYDRDEARGGYYRDYDRGYDRDYDRGYGRGFRRDYGDRDYDEGRRAYSSGRYFYQGRTYPSDYEDRGFFERAGDEVRSWFGDEGAERRRERDERYGRGYERRGRYDRRRASDRDYDYGYGDYRYGRGYEEDEGYRDYGRYEGRGYGRGGYDEGPDTMSYSYTEVWMIPGPHTGRGPEGYERSKERIEEDVSERLTRHGQIDASKIRVKVENGEVTLEGTVDARETKRLAEDVAESVSGVRDVHNHLSVASGKQQSTQENGASAQGGKRAKGTS